MKSQGGEMELDLGDNSQEMFGKMAAKEDSSEELAKDDDYVDHSCFETTEVTKEAAGGITDERITHDDQDPDHKHEEILNITSNPDPSITDHDTNAETLDDIACENNSLESISVISAGMEVQQGSGIQQENARKEWRERFPNGNPFSARTLLSCPKCKEEKTCPDLVKHLIESSECLAAARRDESLQLVIFGIDRIQRRTCPLCEKRKCSTSQAVYHYIQGMCLKKTVQPKDYIALDTNGFCCTLCSATKPTRLLMKQHIVRCHRRKDFACPECHLKFASNLSLEKHKQACEKYVWCQLCSQNITKNYYKTHLKLLHEAKEVRCSHDGCDYVCSSASYLKRHVASRHSDVEFLCDVCGKSFSVKSSLKNHVQVMHQGVKRVKKKEIPRETKCSVCGWTLLKKNLKVHMKRKHSDAKKAFKCLKCGKNFSAKSSLVKHSKLHLLDDSGSLAFPCDVCGKKFVNDLLRKEHRVFTHTKCKYFTCGGCRKSYRWYLSLQQHQANSCSHKHSICSSCRKEFTTPLLLKSHILADHASEDVIPTEVPASTSDTLYFNESKSPVNQAISHIIVQEVAVDPSHQTGQIFGLTPSGGQPPDSEVSWVVGDSLQDLGQPRHSVVNSLPVEVVEIHTDFADTKFSEGQTDILTENDQFLTDPVTLEIKTGSSAEVEECRYICGQCGQTFSSLGEVDLHIDAEHNE